MLALHLTVSFLVKHRHARRGNVILLRSLRDRSIHGAVYNNNLVNLVFFCCDVKQDRNWEFFEIHTMLHQ